MNNPIIYVTRKAHFNAAHKLCNPNWSEEKNYEVFGKCANPNWHGHNFDIFITLKGTVNPETGFVMDFKVLKEIIETHVIEPLDHKNLNLDVPFFKDLLPSVENIAIVIWDILTPHITSNAQLHKITVYETERNFVDYYGPNSL